MILNPEWLKPEAKPYFHQISMDCIGRLIECVERVDKGEIDAVKHRAEQCFATLV